MDIMNIIITEKAKNIFIKLYSNKIHRIMPKVIENWAGITYVLVQDEQLKMMIAYMI